MPWKARLVYKDESRSLGTRSQKTYVQRPDGSVTVLELTLEESPQFTGELLSSADRFVASDLYIRKIAPLLGEPVVQSAAQATRPDVPTPPRQN